MSTYLISDIHGCNTTFRKALKSVKLKKTDILFILGDLIDRGPDSKGVLDTIFLLLEHDFKVICIKGNHEQMLIDSFDDINMRVNWMKNGGKETLKSFLTSDIEKIPKKYIDYIKSMDTYIQFNNFILVHAGINMKKQAPFADEHTLLWLRKWEDVYDKEWLGNRKVVHGHTPMIEDEIRAQFEKDSDVICIDNGSYMNSKIGFGSICVYRVEDRFIHFEKKN